MKRGPRRASATLMPVIRDQLLRARLDARRDIGDGAHPARAEFRPAELSSLLGELWTQLQAVRAAQLWFVTWEMTRLAVTASETLPDWSPQAVRPSPTGIIVWERGTGMTVPWTGPRLGPAVRGAFGQEIGTEVAVDGLLWWGEADGLALGLLTADPRAAVASDSPGDILCDVETDEVIVDDAGRAAHGVRVGALLGATWLLASQPTIGTQRLIRGDRDLAGLTLPSDITVVDLRTLVEAHGDHEPGHRDVYHDHRWLVRGHWRQQRCGPGGSQRRPTWVVPHLKGPAGAPVHLAEQVMVWRR